MQTTLVEWIQVFARGLIGDNEDISAAREEINESEEMLSYLESARQEWLAAQSYFDNVTDETLVDHAILSMQAAERKYMYLLGEAKKLGLRNKEGHFEGSHFPITE